MNKFKELLENKEYKAAALDYAQGGPQKRRKEKQNNGIDIKSKDYKIVVYQNVRNRVDILIDGQEIQVDTKTKTMNGNPSKKKLDSLFPRTEWYNMSDILSSKDIDNILKASKQLGRK